MINFDLRLILVSTFLITLFIALLILLKYKDIKDLIIINYFQLLNKIEMISYILNKDR